MKQEFYTNIVNQVFYGAYPAMNASNVPENPGHINSRMVDSSLIDACICGNYDIVKALLNNGVDVNQNEGKNITPLICAALNGHVKIVELLISFGAKISYNLLCIIKERIDDKEANTKKEYDDLLLMKKWEYLLDFLIIEGKRQ